MADEIKLAAYQFADSMPTENKAQLGALIIKFINENYRNERLKESPEPTTARRISISDNVCVACEG